MFSYLYNVSSKLIGDERYSVLDITKKVKKRLGNMKKFSYLWLNKKVLYIIETYCT